MMRIFRRVKRGLGYIEGYGHHPGLRPFCFLAAIGFCFGWIAGTLHMLFWLALLCYGAHQRSKEAGL